MDRRPVIQGTNPQPLMYSPEDVRASEPPSGDRATDGANLASTTYCPANERPWASPTPHIALVREVKSETSSPWVGTLQGTPPETESRGSLDSVACRQLLRVGSWWRRAHSPRRAIDIARILTRRQRGLVRVRPRILAQAILLTCQLTRGLNHFSLVQIRNSTRYPGNQQSHTDSSNVYVE